VESQVVRAITLIVTADCNLRCRYCYENAKKKQRMEWPTLRAALDLGLSRGQRGIKLIFSGGEPLLEFPLIRRAVSYVKSRAPARLSPRFMLLTNGLLLDDRRIEFLKQNRFEVQLSFDGVRKAQDVRGRGTFDELDRLLTRLSRRHPGFFRRDVKVSMTVTPRTVEHMADSVSYFLQKGVERLAIAPSLTDCSDWRPRRDKELKNQFARMARTSLGHYRRMGKTPLLMFRGDDGGRNPLGLRRAWVPGFTVSMCGAMRGEKLAVDVDGGVLACVTLAGSYQRFRSPLLRDAAKSMRLGTLRRTKAGRPTGQPVLRSVVRCPEIFLAKEDKRSSYRRCRECKYFAFCVVCPASIGYAKGRQDPRRIPDFDCAFSFAAARQWERFRKEVASISE
jgi:sulfatase maturation enzyme AslB (radical SAM superfamily)